MTVRLSNVCLSIYLSTRHTRDEWTDCLEGNGDDNDSSVQGLQTKLVMGKGGEGKRSKYEGKEVNIGVGKTTETHGGE